MTAEDLPDIDVSLADEATLIALEKATANLDVALRAMPNRTASVFAPAVDVPIIARALETVRQVHVDARLEVERRDREAGR